MKRRQHWIPWDDQEHCLVAERMAREGRYDDVMAEKDTLKYTLMETEQHCLGLMIEVQLRYIECADIQDEKKQVVIERDCQLRSIARIRRSITTSACRTTTVMLFYTVFLTLRFKLQYSKPAGTYITKPIKVAKTYNFRTELLCMWCSDAM